MSSAKVGGFALPPHANAEVHKQIMRKLRAMNSAQFFETLVDAGIYDRQGKLRPEYAASDASETAPLPREN